MKLKAFAAVLALGVLLSGCSSLMSREYIWTEPYQLPQSPEAGEQVSVSNYLQLQKTLTDMVEAGETYRTVSVANYKSQWLEEDVASAVDALRSSHPIGAYAVDHVDCEMGSIAGELVMVIRIGYRHDRVDVDSIEYVENIDAAKQAVANALKAMHNELTNKKAKPVDGSSAKCPKCGEPLINEGGCNICKNCGWSRCD